MKLTSIQEMICDLSVEIISTIETLIPNSEPVASPLSTHSAQVNPHQPTTYTRLPKLEIKHFNGDLLEWVSFINLFNSTIHRDTTIPAVTKFQYLLSVLSGEPQNLIKSLPLSAANYLVAYDLLNERYHSPRRLVTLHLNQILDLPLVNHTPKSMRHFVNSYFEHTQALKGLNTDITDRNALLSAMILRKMDSDLRKRFETFRSSARSYQTNQGSDDEHEPSVLPDVVM